MLVSHFAWALINCCVVAWHSSSQPQPQDAAAVPATEPLIEVDASEHPTKRQKTDHPQTHSESSMASQATGPKQPALPPVPSDLAIGPAQSREEGQPQVPVSLAEGALLGGPPAELQGSSGAQTQRLEGGVPPEQTEDTEAGRVVKKARGVKKERVKKTKKPRKTAEDEEEEKLPQPRLERPFLGLREDVLAGNDLVQFVDSEVSLQYGSGTVAEQEKYCALLKCAAARIDRVPASAINHRPPTRLTTRPFLLPRRTQLIENFNFDLVATCIVVVEDDCDAQEHPVPSEARTRAMSARKAWQEYDLRNLLTGLLGDDTGGPTTPLYAFTLTGNHSTDALVHLVELGTVSVERAVRCCYVYFRTQLEDEHFQFLARFENETCAAEAELTASYNLFSDPQYLCPFIRKHWVDLGRPDRQSEAFVRRMTAVLEFRAETQQQKAATQSFIEQKNKYFRDYMTELNELMRNKRHYAGREYEELKKKVRERAVSHVVHVAVFEFTFRLQNTNVV